MKKIIKVTKTDIRLGGRTPGNGNSCIIARAVRRAGLKNVTSGYSYVNFGVNQFVNLPAAARRIQSLFFSNDYKVALKKAKPFQFAIEY